MPEITLLGWFHTVIGIAAVISGFYTLAVHKIITSSSPTGKFYLLATFVTAATSLMIYNQGGFGPAHVLGVLTLMAFSAGWLVMRIGFLSAFADYLQAFCYSATLLFHMIPAITDGLLRLPVGDPVLTDPHDPLLKQFYLLFLALFLIGFVLQCVWLKRRNNA